MPPTDSGSCSPQKMPHLEKQTNRIIENNPEELLASWCRWDFSYYQSLSFQLHSRLAGGTSLSPVGWKAQVKKMVHFGL